MTCECAARAVPLYLYGELPPETEEQVEEHIANCADCAGELERQRTLSRTLHTHELEPSLDLLVQCRQSLARQLREVEHAPPTSFRQRVFDVFWSSLRIPAGAVALFALGWFAARLPLGSILPGAANEPALVSTIRSIEPETDGRILISIDDTKRRVVSGSLGSDNIRQLLLVGLREGTNSGVRVESASVLKDLSASLDVRNALLDVLQHDPNPGVRLKALEGLQQFAYDPAVRHALTAVLLGDSNSGIRIQAIDLLTARHDGSLAGILQSLVRKDDNDYIRLRSERALQEMNASVGTF